MIACSFTHNVNNNVILGTSLLIMIIGWVGYIYLNKKIVD